MKHVFIIGSKGIPAKYGGFETFVEKLTEQQKNKEIQIYCKRQPDKIWNHQITSCSRNFRKCFCT